MLNLYITKPNMTMIKTSAILALADNNTTAARNLLDILSGWLWDYQNGLRDIEDYGYLIECTEGLMDLIQQAEKPTVVGCVLFPDDDGWDNFHKAQRCLWPGQIITQKPEPTDVFHNPPAGWACDPEPELPEYPTIHDVPKCCECKHVDSISSTCAECMETLYRGWYGIVNFEPKC